MDPRTRDFVKVGGRSYRREPLDAAWILERFPAPDYTASRCEHARSRPRPRARSRPRATTARADEDARAEAEADARRRFALAQIRQYGDPALRLKAHEVADFDDDLRRLVERMTALMHDAQGVGLAATQVGVLRRLFVFEPDEEGPRAIVNPVDRRALATRPETDEEGCLSLQGVRVPVERATQRDARGQGRRTATTCATSSTATARASCSTSSTISTAC